MRQSRGMRPARKIAMIVVAGAALLGMFVGATPAEAWTVTPKSSPGSVYEPLYYIHCNSTSSPSLGVEGVQTSASPAYSGPEKVAAAVYLYKMTSSGGWSLIGSQALGWSWTRVGYGSVSFRAASWSLGSHGYYTAVVQVQWWNEYGGFLGEATIRPSQRDDFTAYNAWYGWPAYCYA
jgi:hypothetical protein